MESSLSFSILIPNGDSQKRCTMQKVSFSFPPELVKTIDRARGEQSRNQFVTRLLKQTLKEERERELARIAEEVYSDAAFAAEEVELSEDFLRIAPEIDP